MTVAFLSRCGVRPGTEERFGGLFSLVSRCGRDQLVKFFEGASQVRCDTLVGCDANAFEEDMIEVTSLGRERGDVRGLALDDEVERSIEGVADVVDFDAGGVDEALELGDFYSDAILFSLEKVDRDCSSEVSAEESSTFIVQCVQSAGVGGQLGAAVLECVGELFEDDPTKCVGDRRVHAVAPPL